MRCKVCGFEHENKGKFVYIYNAITCVKCALKTFRQEEKGIKTA